MGQTVGRMPKTWDGLLEEKDRVLYWSGEVLSKVADNVHEEEALQIDYSSEIIDEKVDTWIETNRTRIEKILSEQPDLLEEWGRRATSGIKQIREEFRLKVRNDYIDRYAALEKFTRKVDELGKHQRKIHWKIQNLEDTCAGDVKKFRKKLGCLRLKTFRNLRVGEKLMFQDKVLKWKFVKQVFKSDRKNMMDCAKRFDKLIKKSEETMLEE
ncbi:uncharacterized protein LOC143374418 [Andrena cerasifolii]|uniref:uncharacterized protein LOC143374418 n=1 Tax=Andrena cerasifolii TaxID=2819439 RepID=UPI00403832A4